MQKKTKKQKIKTKPKNEQKSKETNKLTEYLESCNLQEIKRNDQVAYKWGNFTL